MGTHVVLAVLLSICSLSISQECNQQLQENVDFPGTDIKFVYAADVEHCQQLCTQHHSCLFFTFIRPDWTQDQRHFYCYLKQTSNGRPKTQTPLLGVTSGYSLKSCNPDSKPCLSKVYQNVDFPGADYRTFFTADYEECQRACTQEPSCQFFTFINEAFVPTKGRYKCHLKFSWSVPKTAIVEKKAGVTSGFSHNTVFHQELKTGCEGKLFPNIDIPGRDIESFPAASPEHCQAMCSTHPSCTFFAFASNTFKCNLKENRDEMVIAAKQGVTSGLPARFCQLDNNWVKVAQEGVDFLGSDIRFELMDDADTCQRTCSQDPNCQFYTYVHETFSNSVYRRRCYLKRVITMPAPPKVTKLLNAVSGFNLRNCV